MAIVQLGIGILNKAKNALVQILKQLQLQLQFVRQHHFP